MLSISSISNFIHFGNAHVTWHASISISDFMITTLWFQAGSLMMDTLTSLCWGYQDMNICLFWTRISAWWLFSLKSVPCREMFHMHSHGKPCFPFSYKRTTGKCQEWRFLWGRNHITSGNGWLASYPEVVGNWKLNASASVTPVLKSIITKRFQPQEMESDSGLKFTHRSYLH